MRIVIDKTDGARLFFPRRGGQMHRQHASLTRSRHACGMEWKACSLCSCRRSAPAAQSCQGAGWKRLQHVTAQLGRQLPVGKPCMQASLKRRDDEIARLAAQLAQGPDVDRLAQQYRNNANEAVILQLNQQVGWMWPGAVGCALPGAGEMLEI